MPILSLIPSVAVNMTEANIPTPNAGQIAAWIRPDGTLAAKLDSGAIVSGGGGGGGGGGIAFPDGMLFGDLLTVSIEGEPFRVARSELPALLSNGDGDDLQWFALGAPGKVLGISQAGRLAWLNPATSSGDAILPSGGVPGQVLTIAPDGSLSWATPAVGAGGTGGGGGGGGTVALVDLTRSALDPVPTYGANSVGAASGAVGDIWTHPTTEGTFVFANGYGGQLPTVSVDFAVARRVDKWRVVSGVGGQPATAHVQLQTSTDGSAWITVDDATNLGGDSGDRVLSAPATARFFRMAAPDTHDAYFAVGHATLKGPA